MSFYQQIIHEQISLAVGANTIDLGVVPAGMLCAAVMVTGATTSAATRPKLGVSNKTLGGWPKQYVDTLVQTTGSARYPTAYVDVVPGQDTVIQIDNYSANPVSATVTISGFGFQAGRMKAEPALVEQFAWFGWSGSNINVFSTSPSNVNAILPCNADMVVTGMEIDFAMAVGNDVTTVFEEVLSIVGYNRSYAPAAFGTGTNAANPSAIAAPGIGWPSTESAVNWGPNGGTGGTGAYPMVLADNILKSSDPSVSHGGIDHISLGDDPDDPLRLFLKAGDELWFHMAGQTTGSETTSQVNAEMQIIIRYSLL